MLPNFGTLLYSGYNYGTKLLDLYGLRANEDHGYIVTTATLRGTSLSLAYVLDDDALDDLGAWLDEQHAIEYRTSRQEARAERALHYREMDALDCCRRSF